MRYDGDIFKDLISKLVSEGYKVYAPVKVGEAHYFRVVSTADEADFEYINTKNSPKEAVFPENEILIRYSDWIDEVPLNEENLAVVGIRPCDARAIRLLDRVFLEDVVDPYYKARRDRLLLVGYACDTAGDYCFCKSLGVNPRDSEDVDIFVAKDGDGYFVKAVSEKGAEILKGFELKEGEIPELELEFSKSVDVENLPERMRKAFDSDYWKEVAENCVSCGTCTFLCPTCYCFDIHDEGEKRGVRLRAWDSCQFPLHTLESSSHNPRSEKWQRLRNRFYDKYYAMLVRKGEIYCVGCGRCIEWCPVGIDIADVISGVR
ncbi:MAG: 4Fe-4S dicluster domain-containing protein [Archaeoglobaceae archaeon]